MKKKNSVVSLQRPSSLHVMNLESKQDPSSASCFFSRDFHHTTTTTTAPSHGGSSRSRSNSPKYEHQSYRLETISSPVSRETLAPSPPPSGSASSVSYSSAGGGAASPQNHRGRRQQKQQPQRRLRDRPRRRCKPPLGSNNNNHHRHPRSVLSDNTSETYFSSDSEVCSEEEDDIDEDYYSLSNLTCEEEGSFHTANQQYQNYYYYEDDQSTVSGRSVQSGRSSVGISIQKQQQLLSTTSSSYNNNNNSSSNKSKQRPRSPHITETSMVLYQPPAEHESNAQQLALLSQQSKNHNSALLHPTPRPIETDDDLADVYQYSDEEDSLADLDELIAESSARWKNDVEHVVQQTVTSQTLQQQQQRLGTSTFTALDTRLSTTVPSSSFSLPSSSSTNNESGTLPTLAAHQEQNQQQQQRNSSEIEALRMVLAQTNVGQKPEPVAPILEVVASNHSTFHHDKKANAVLTDEELTVTSDILPTNHPQQHPYPQEERRRPHHPTKDRHFS